MMFDKMCQFAESSVLGKERARLIAGLRQTAVFKVDLDNVRHECLITDKDDQEYRRRMFLPFEWTWIEGVSDGRFGWLLTTDISNALGRDDYFEKIIGNDGVKTTDSKAMYQITACRNPGGFSLFMFGMCVPYEDASGKFGFRSATFALGRMDRRGNCDLQSAEGLNEVADDQKTALASLMSGGPQALQLINSPSRWIIKREDVMARPVYPHGPIPRAHQRPRYIVVSDKEIERVIRDPNPANVGTVRPHRRRAHSHLLKSERFTWKRGQRVFVKACWVGPESAEYGGERYSVCLDL